MKYLSDILLTKGSGLILEDSGDQASLRIDSTKVNLITPTARDYVVSPEGVERFRVKNTSYGIVVSSHTVPVANNTHDIGSTSLRFRAAYIVTGDFSGQVTIGSIPHMATATGNVLVGNSGVVSYRTSGEILTDIGAMSSTGSFYLGTTSIALNRASASQSLTGINIDGNAGTATLSANSTLWANNPYSGSDAAISTYMLAWNGSAWFPASSSRIKTFLGYYTSGDNVSFGIITTGVWNATPIANAYLANSAITIGSTSISLGGTSTTLAGLSSVTSTSFVGALTGNASTATALQTGRTISISGDLTYTSPSFDGTGNVTAAGTLATVNSNVGTFGSSTAIPTFTVNAKGLITAVSTNAVIAPAGTLTGTTLASNVVSSSLTSVGTITSGVWNGTVISSSYIDLSGETLATVTGRGATSATPITLSAALTISNANINLSNAYFLAGRNAANNANIALIGFSAADKVSIDPNGYGVITGGNLTVSGGTVTASTFTGNAATATQVYVTADNTTAAYYPLAWVTGTGGNANIYASPSKILFKPSTGELNGVQVVMSGSVTASSFSGSSASLTTTGASALLVGTASNPGSYNAYFASTVGISGLVTMGNSLNVTGDISMSGTGYMGTNFFWYGRNNANNAWKKLIGFTSSDIVSIDGDGMGTVFGGSLSAGAISGTTATFTSFSAMGSNTKYFTMYDAVAGGELKYASVANVQSYLGLGPNAYTSTAYLPLTGGTLSGSLTVSVGSGYNLTLEKPTGAYLQFTHGGTQDAAINATNSGSLEFGTGVSGTIALTINSSQQATFASSVTAGGLIYTTFSSSGNNAAIFKNSNSAGYGTALIGGNSTLYALLVRNYDESVNALSLLGNGNATFAGSLSAGAISGTSGSFSGPVDATGSGVYYSMRRDGNNSVQAGWITYNSAGTSGFNWQLNGANSELHLWSLTSGTWSDVVTFTKSGAATFASSVTASGNLTTTSGSIYVSGNSQGIQFKSNTYSAGHIGGAYAASDFCYSSAAGDFIVARNVTAGYSNTNLILANQNNGQIQFSFGSGNNDTVKAYFQNDGWLYAFHFSETSDRRLKTEKNANPNFYGIENLKARLYEKEGHIEVGYYAQDVLDLKIIDHAVTKDLHGYYSLSYSEVHTAKISRLEERVLELEKQIIKLGGSI